MALPPHELGDALSPVREPTAGGRYRAMVFHLGVLWRLDELGYLARLDRISSVSGGSITAAMLGLKWPSVRRACVAGST